MKIRFTILVTMLAFSLVAVQCTDDNEGTDGTGRLKVKVTDAPSDDAQVKGTFITISEVKINGKTVNGFTAQTIEISAYQDGKAKLIFEDDLEAKTYSNVSLVLNYEKDDSGNEPGCYVLTDDNAKHQLEASATGEVSLDESFELTAGGTTDLVIDFDLRKAIVRDDEGTTGEYKFVTEAELKNSIRLVDENECGDIRGKVNGYSSVDGTIIVFAYKKGTFNLLTETQAQGSSGVMFSNAVTSAKVKADGSYQLSFLEKGDYELRVISCEEDEHGYVHFKAMVDAVSAISGLIINNLSVEAKNQLNLDIEISAGQ